eukprot:1772728-Amphidinium_carterae.1
MVDRRVLLQLVGGLASNEKRLPSRSRSLSDPFDRRERTTSTSRPPGGPGSAPPDGLPAVSESERTAEGPRTSRFAARDASSSAGLLPQDRLLLSLLLGGLEL